MSEYDPKFLAAKHADEPLPPNPKQIFGDTKVPLAYVPATSIIYEAMALEEGARKYGPFNWRQNSVEAMCYAHAGLRHLFAWIDGEDIDPESGKPHLGLAKACLGIIIDSTEIGNLIDNRPPACPTGAILRKAAKGGKAE